MPDQTLYIHKDASERYWSALLTQVPKEKMEVPLENHDKKYIPFLGVNLQVQRKAELNSRKRDSRFSICTKKSNYLLLGYQSVHISTDHRNILLLPAPKL